MNGENYSAESGRRAEPDRVVERIHREEARAGYHAEGDREKTLNWNDPEHRALVRDKFGSDEGEAMLPGFGPSGNGENAREDCGDPHPFVCDSCGHSVDFGRTCAQSTCNRCAVAWVRDLAISKSAKVRRIRKEKDWHTPDAEHQKIHHFIISPSLGWFYALARGGHSIEEAQEKTKEVVKVILDELRAQGAVIRHSFRGADDDGSVASESDDRGFWKDILNNPGLDWSDVRDELAWKPHYHCVVVADWLQGEGFTDVVEAETGWVCHRIANEDTGVSIENDGAMARVLTYALSHGDIVVRDDENNRSANWWVGAFDGDIIRSDSRFTAKPHDLEWADAAVRRIAHKTLGLKSGTTDCGADLPGVDDPDELARRIMRELYPDDPEGRREVDTDTVLAHVAEGNIRVSVSSSSGGGGDVTVRDAFGSAVPAGGWGAASDLPDVSTSAVAVDGGAEPVSPLADSRDQEASDDCGCGDDHQEDDECGGTLIPLGEARRRGLLDDDEWCADAPHVDEAREADSEWPEDLNPWRAKSPGRSVGAG